MAEIGDSLHGNILIKYITQGSYGNIFLSYDKKRKLFNIIKEQESLKIVKKENAFLQQPHISSQYIPAVIQTFEDDGFGYQKFELYACDVRSLLNTRQYSTGLPLSHIKNITHGVLVALSKLHDSDKVYNDMKLDNIMLRGTNIKLKGCIKRFKSRINGVKSSKINELYVSDIDDSESDSSSHFYSTDESSESCYDDDNESLDDIGDIILKEDFDACRPVLIDYSLIEQSDTKHKSSLIIRDFRSPDNICTNTSTKSDDIWSLGHNIYMMLCGTYLYQTSTTSKQKNRCQLEDIISYAGPLINTTDDIKIFRLDGTVKSTFNIQHRPLINRIEEDCKMYSTNAKRIIDDEVIDDDVKLIELVHLLQRMLHIDKYERFTVHECLNHPFFK